MLGGIAKDDIIQDIIVLQIGQLSCLDCRYVLHVDLELV